MKRTLLSAIAIASLLIVPISQAKSPSVFGRDSASDTFWAGFQAAVTKQDVDTAASMTRFPLLMPYGQRSIANRAMFAKKYSSIFDKETRKCFAAAKPEFEQGVRNKFSISCGEAMMYWFEKVNGQYKFTSVDNVNE